MPRRWSDNAGAWLSSREGVLLFRAFDGPREQVRRQPLILTQPRAGYRIIPDASGRQKWWWLRAEGREGIVAVDGPPSKQEEALDGAQAIDLAREDLDPAWRAAALRALGAHPTP